nr:uncharacterized protein LOC110082542 [Pogona vitticeps]
MGAVLNRLQLRAERDGSRSNSPASTPSSDALTPLQFSPAVTPDFQAETSVDPTLCSKNMLAFRPTKKEDRPQPEGASCDMAVSNATACLVALSECGQVRVEEEEAPQPSKAASKGPGEPPGEDMLETRIVMGEETQCLSEEEEEAEEAGQQAKADVLTIGLGAEEEEEEEGTTGQVLWGAEELLVEPSPPAARDPSIILSLPDLQKHKEPEALVAPAPG